MHFWPPGQASASLWDGEELAEMEMIGRILYLPSKKEKDPI
jgi:hypothetical protein